MSPDERSSAGDQPAAKIAAPPLTARAPRPAAIQIRKSMVLIVGVGAAGLVAGALAWSLVVQPEIRAKARAQAAQTEDSGRGEARPSEAVTLQPATYDRLAPPSLPEPRRLNEASAEVKRRGPTTSRSRPAPRTAPAELARTAQSSGLFFERSAASGSADKAPEKHLARAADETSYPTDLVAPLSPFELKAGAIIPASLLTGVDTARPGPIVATVTETVFDTVSGQHCVVPPGSRLIGRHEGASRYGERRAFLTWDRLILPDGKSISLRGASGVDAEGVAGVPGRADRRLASLGVASLFAGALTALGEFARDKDDDGGLIGDAGDAAAIEAAQVGSRLIDRELQVAPSIRLRPGAQMAVLITEDVMLAPCRP